MWGCAVRGEGREHRRLLLPLPDVPEGVRASLWHPLRGGRAERGVDGRSARLLSHSSKVARRGFCRDCGTPLTFEYLDLDELHLAVGSLDEPGRFRPVAHYGTEGIVEPFFTDDGLPRERTEDDEELVARWRAAHVPGSVPGPLSGPPSA